MLGLKRGVVLDRDSHITLTLTTPTPTRILRPSLCPRPSGVMCPVVTGLLRMQFFSLCASGKVFVSHPSVTDVLRARKAGLALLYLLCRPPERVSHEKPTGECFSVDRGLFPALLWVPVRFRGVACRPCQPSSSSVWYSQTFCPLFLGVPAPARSGS